MDTAHPFFLERLRQDLRVKDALYLGLTVAMQGLAGTLQVCFYTYIMVTLYIIFCLYSLDPAKRSRFALLSVLSFALGCLMVLPQILATYELSTMAVTTKLASYEFFSSFAFPVYMIPTFLFPFLYYYGGSYSSDFWGPTPELGQEAFVGTLPFVLCILIFFRWKRNPLIFFWGMMAVLAFLLALGDSIRPLNKLLFHLPVYNVFRGPSKHILEVSFSMSILVGFGMSFLMDREKERRFRTELVIALSAVILASLIGFTLFHDALRDFFRDSFSQMQHFQLRWERGDVPKDALSMSDPGIYIPILTISAYLASVLVRLKAGKSFLRDAALVAIFFLIFAEAMLYKKEPLPDADAVRNYNKQMYDVILLSGNSGRAIFMSSNMVPLNAMTRGIRLVEGYHPLQLEEYQKILPSMWTQPPGIWRTVIMNNSLLSILNVKYLVVDNIVGNPGDVRWYFGRDGEGRSVPFPPVAKRPDGADYLPIYRALATGPSFSIYENMIALPRAHSVKGLKPVDSADELLKRIFSYRVNPWYEAAVSTKDLREIGADSFSPGEVSISEDRPDRVTVSARFRGTGFVVLADQFYPGWEAYIDGKPAKIYKTNAVQRGVVVPEGEHALVFTYVPRRIYAAMVVSGVLLMAIFLSLFRDIRKKRNVT